MIDVLSPTEIKEMRTNAISELKKAQEIADILIDKSMEDELRKAKKGRSAYLNPDNTFKGGFKGCVKYQQSKGLAEENAKKLCAYIGRRAGKI